MPHASSRGCRIHYDLHGDPSAPALVLVRGLARSSRYWGAALEALARRFRVVTFDNRGVGRSASPRPPYSTATMADDVAAVLDAAGIPRAHVFGMSLGGMIAQRFAVRHSDRVDRLILGCTTFGGRRAAPYPWRGRLALLRAMTAPPERATETIAPILLSRETLDRRPEVVADWRAIAATEPRSLSGLLGQIAAAVTHRAYDDLARVRAPTMVITGDADRLIAADNSRLLADRIPGAVLRLIRGAGHDFVTDRPDETVQAFRDFLDAG